MPGWCRNLWLKRAVGKPEEIPRAIGFSLIALCLLTVAATATWYVAIGRGNLRRERIERAAERIEALSRHVATLFETDPHSAAAEVRRYARGPGVSYCFVTDPTDHYLIHLDPRKIGGKWTPDASAPPRHPKRAQWWERPTAPHGAFIEYAAPVRSTNGGVLGYVRAAYSPQAGAFQLREFAVAAACVLLATMGMLLLVYRWLRRTVRPMAAVRDSLLAYEAGIEPQISALRISDCFGQVSAAWNNLLEFLDKTEQELRQQQSRLRVAHALDKYRSDTFEQILKGLPCGVVQIAEDRRVAYANPAAIALLQVPEAQLLGATCDELCDDPVVRHLLQSLGDGFGGAPVSVDRQISSHEGSTTVRLSVIHGAAGDERVILLQDVSQLKEAEKVREEFLYHVSHELRTPLTSIRAYAETLANEMFTDQETHRECYNVIIGETTRLARLIEDVLNISQLEVGTAQLHMGNVYPDRLLRDVIQDVQAAADERGVELTLKLPAKVPAVTGDKERLQVVFNNILGNAIKYTPNGGRVEVVAAIEKDQLLVSVSDTGVGIDPANHEQVFEKFCREEDALVQGQPGTGLGLTIARETVRAHGGEITIDSRKGQGATFHVQLPIDAEGQTQLAATGAAQL